ALYDILFLGLVWIVLRIVEKRLRPRVGTLFRLFMIGYGLFRFTVDFVKPRHALLIGLSSIQLAALFIASYYSVTLIIRHQRRSFSIPLEQTVDHGLEQRT